MHPRASLTRSLFLLALAACSCHSALPSLCRLAFGHAVAVPVSLRTNPKAPSPSVPASVSMTRAYTATIAHTSRRLTAMQARAAVLRAQLEQKRMETGRFRAAALDAAQLQFPY